MQVVVPLTGQEHRQTNKKKHWKCIKLLVKSELSLAFKQMGTKVNFSSCEWSDEGKSPLSFYMMII